MPKLHTRSCCPAKMARLVLLRRPILDCNV
nr:MAG TPA: hypothetical protein [Caudoviricetes sp.]